MSMFDWIQAAIDVIIVVMIALHSHPVTWRRR